MSPLDTYGVVVKYEKAADRHNGRHIGHHLTIDFQSRFRLACSQYAPVGDTQERYKHAVIEMVLSDIRQYILKEIDTHEQRP